jgi:diadenosine tetraphosphate (Ap4A) HIT family hydrolase
MKTIYDEQNIFAKILRGELSCKKIYEDDKVLAFEDIAPQAPIHILIIPKNKYISFEEFVSEADNNEITHFFKIIAKIANDNNLENGYRLITNKGYNGGQIVPHFHVHLLGGKKLSL